MKKLVMMVLVLGLLAATSNVCAEVLYDYKSGIFPWATEKWDQGAPTLRWSDKYEGSLEVDTSSIEVNSDNWAKFFIKADKAFDLSDKKVYSLDIYVPKNIYYCKVKMVIRAGSGWKCYESEEYSLENNDTWQNVTFDLGKVDSLSDVRQVGLEIQGFMSEEPVLYIKNVTAK
jgi:hypothetical protein